MKGNLERYDAWIANYVASGRPIIGECLPVCKEMLERFPELVLHGGYVHTPLGPDLHYWLTAPGGELVDPTASQFDHWEGLGFEDYEDAGTTDPMQLLRRFLIEDTNATTSSRRGEVPLFDSGG